MPRLTADELTAWLHDFCEHDAADAGSPRVIDASWDPTAVDTGLVVARLRSSGTEAYLKREVGGSPDWSVTFEARESDAELTADQVATLAAEVAAIGRLCAFLSERTAALQVAPGA